LEPLVNPVKIDASNTGWIYSISVVGIIICANAIGGHHASIRDTIAARVIDLAPGDTNVGITPNGGEAVEDPDDVQGFSERSIESRRGDFSWSSPPRKLLSLFAPFDVVNIGGRPKPSDDLAPFVTLWHCTCDEPAVNAIVAAIANFDGKVAAIA
jgi:hypothetical protein